MPRADDDSLSGIAAISADNVWAVGAVGANATTAPLIEHWNGRSWKRVPSPSIGTEHYAFLISISAISASDIWATGTYQHGPAQSFRYVPFTVHWNGRKWRVVPTPLFGHGHFLELSGVDAVSASQVWAVGFTGLATTEPVIERFNGAKWRRVTGPDPGGANATDALFGVVSTRAGSWAVGYRTNAPGVTVPLIEWWNGRRWKLVSCPLPPGKKPFAELASVAALSATNVWAVGSSVGVRPLAEHWNGRKWTLVRIPVLA